MLHHSKDIVAVKLESDDSLKIYVGKFLKYILKANDSYKKSVITNIIDKISMK